MELRAEGHCSGRGRLINRGRNRAVTLDREMLQDVIRRKL